MRKTILNIGILLLIVGLAVEIVCFALPSLTNNRISFSESLFGLIPAGVLFLVGSVFVASSLILIAGARKTAALYRKILEPEGIIFFDEDLKGSMTFRNFHAPGRYDSWRKVAVAALLALTNKRLVALKGSYPIIDVPLNDARLRQMKFSVEGENKLCVAFNANLFQPDWSGEIEYRFKTSRANEYAQKLAELTK